MTTKIGEILGGSVWADADGVLLVKGSENPLKKPEAIAMTMKSADARAFARLLSAAADKVDEPREVVQSWKKKDDAASSG